MSAIECSTKYAVPCTKYMRLSISCVRIIWEGWCVRVRASQCKLVHTCKFACFEVAVKCSTVVCVSVSLGEDVSCASVCITPYLPRKHQEISLFQHISGFFFFSSSLRVPWVKISFHSLCDLTDWSQLKVKKIAVFVAGLSQTHTSHSRSLS